MEDKIILQLKNVSKNYGKHQAVKEVNLTLEKGEIYGLIGENGAGKTSIMRLITGLTNKTAGEINYPADLKIGSIIESPAFYDKLTGFENLMYYAKALDIEDAENYINWIMLILNLNSVGKKRFGDYSLGMKQRLGLGLTLLNRPDLLVLDEPINGLDPSGIIHIRRILKNISHRGITILISSHILTELSMLATKYGFIHNGELIKELTSEELKKELHCHINVNTDNNELLENYLNETSHHYKTESEGITVDAGDDLADELSQYLYERNVKVKRLEVIRESLEDYFVRLKGGNGEDVAIIKG